MVKFINFSAINNPNFENRLLIDIYLNSLTFHFTNKNYNQLLNEINNNILNNKFLDENSKATIIKNYKINRKIIDVMNGYKTKLDSKKRSIINPNFLNLESTNIENLSEKIIINEKNTNKIYAFTPESMASLFKMALLNQEESIPYPCYPKNPYTNVKFTLKENLYIYQELDSYYKNKNRKIPLIIRLFRESQFNLDKFSSIHNNYLGILACNNFVKSLAQNDFNEMLKEFIIDNKMNRKICYKCIIEKYNGKLKEAFQSLLITYQCENNDLYQGSISSRKMLKNIIKNLNLKIDEDHYKIHRKIYVMNGRRSRNLNRNTNSFRFDLNEPVNYNFTNNNSGEIFIFGQHGNDNHTDSPNDNNREELSNSEIINSVNIGETRRIVHVNNERSSNRRRFNSELNNTDRLDNQDESVNIDNNHEEKMDETFHSIQQEEKTPESDETIQQEDVIAELSHSSEESIQQEEEKMDESSDETIQQEDDIAELSHSSEESIQQEEEKMDESSDETIQQEVDIAEERMWHSWVEQRAAAIRQEEENDNSNIISNIQGRSLYSTPITIPSNNVNELRIRIPIVNIPSDDFEDRYSRIITNNIDREIYDIRYDVNEEISEFDGESENITDLLNRYISDQSTIIDINIDDNASLRNFIINCPLNMHSKLNINTRQSKINGMDLTIIKEAFLNINAEKPPLERVLSDDTVTSIDYDDIQDEIVL